MTMFKPVTQLNIPSGQDEQKNAYLVFRDDIYPFLGGGNKGRKIDYIARDVFAKKANALVTTGGIQSNHCRAVAVFAVQNGFPCTLVLHGSKEQFHTQSGNAKIMRDTGVNVVFVSEPSEIGSTMDSAMAQYQTEGLEPYYIYGGGHTMEGGLAYIEAVKELKAHCDQHNCHPDYIFLASGTGSTQAGILAGLDQLKLKSKVIGISVGRQRDAAEKVVAHFYHELCEHYQIDCTQRDVVVLDDYLCGGYALYNEEIKTLSQKSLRVHGFTLDTTYTAKAFYGMQQYIQADLLENKTLLFWHTGGVFNYLAE